MTPLAFCLCIVLGTGEPDAWIAEDKWKHFFASFAITTLAASGGRAAGLAPGASLGAGVGVAAGAGVWKEWRDTRRPDGVVSVRDLVWDAGGIAAGAVVVRRGR
ncbi:MAG: hypothetical protein M3409_06000 [Gemmatimonadota bacterium]|nr:hypothetical protein [Gemmatimonadota bacterium]